MKLLAVVILALLAGCAPRVYEKQDNFDQWASSCKMADDANPSKCAQTMYTMEQRQKRQEQWTLRLW